MLWNLLLGLESSDPERGGSNMCVPILKLETTVKVVKAERDSSLCSQIRQKLKQNK